MAQPEPMARARRRPLWRPSETTAEVTLSRQAIERMLRHRDPMLLLDRIDAVDLSQRSLRAWRRIDPADPVLEGHFPDHPVYPGALLVEALGQASLCLHHLIERGDTEVTEDDQPLPVRLLRIRQALFSAEVGPGDEVALLCHQLEDDSFTVSCIAQAMVDGRVCALTEMDVFLAED